MNHVRLRDKLNEIYPSQDSWLLNNSQDVGFGEIVKKIYCSFILRGRGDGGSGKFVGKDVNFSLRKKK